MGAGMRFGSIAVVLLLVGCGDDPEPPRFRLKNEAVEDASVQIKTTGGSTLNINNIKPGYVSEYQNSAEGLIEITATVKSDTSKFTGSFQAREDKSFTIRITNPPGVKIESP